MEVKTSDKICIITPFSPKLASLDAKKLIDEILVKLNNKQRVGIDMSYVHDCTIEFLEMISKIGNLGIFNISSDIFTLFNLMSIDKKVDLYVSELDFIANKHKLLNRKFSLV